MLLINQEGGHYREISDQGLDLSLSQHIKTEVWDFPVMTKWMRLISYVFFGLSIMDLSLWSIKTNNWSADNCKKTGHGSA